MTSFINIDANYFYEISNNKFLVYFRGHYIGAADNKQGAEKLVEKHYAQQEN